MLAFLDRLMEFVEKRCTLTFCLCMGTVLLFLIVQIWFDLDDGVFELCMVPLNLLFWPLLIIWWREFRQGVYATKLVRLPLGNAACSCHSACHTGPPSPFLICANVILPDEPHAKRRPPPGNGGRLFVCGERCQAVSAYSMFMRLKARIRPENTMETVEHSLIRMFREGPEVSLKGSPTVSPTTAALCCSEPLPP